ncbi:Flagellar biosynthetic protein FlhB, partial [Durusdinium trenchii]
MADAPEQSSKTEAPTLRRRERARREGQVVYSSDLTSSLMLFLIALLSLYFSHHVGLSLSRTVKQSLTHLAYVDWGIPETVTMSRWFVGQLWILAGSIGAIVLGVSALIATSQTGFVWSSEALNLKWERLSPTQGWSRLLSWDSVIKGALTVLKVAGLMVLAFAFFSAVMDGIAAQSQHSLRQTVTYGWQQLVQLTLLLSGAALIAGLIDYGTRWFRNEQKLRMTREEVKQEQKDEQGDPHVRSRMRRQQRDAIQQRSIREVPSATVVVRNPTHFAVALRYTAGDDAPTVVSKGTGLFAKRIIRVAEEHGVPVLERKPLARALYKLVPIGKPIPGELYRAVAEILAYVYRIQG